MHTYTYLALPKRGAPESPRLTGDQLRKRLKTELCIPIEEDYGYAEWLWFPARSLSATAHWLVQEAPPQLIGEVFRPADQEAFRIFYALSEDPDRAWMHGDGDWNTFMVLPACFERTSLLPRFARDAIDLNDSELSGKHEAFRGESDDEIRWRLSVIEAVAVQSDPEDYLMSLRGALSQIAIDKEVM